MRGIRVSTRSGRSLDICTKCYEKEDEEISLALKYSLVTKPIVTIIKQCQMCEDTDEAIRGRE